MADRKQVNNYTIMHCDDIVATVSRKNNSVKVEMPEKMPFGLRDSDLDYADFYDWMQKRVDNINRSYMNKVYMARGIGRDIENVIADSCAISITDKFWIRRSDIETNWELLNKMRDNNSDLTRLALFGDIEKINYEKLREGTTSLFAAKGNYTKAIQGKHMRKIGGTQQYEWVATMIGNTLDIPVQQAKIINPSVGGARDSSGILLGINLDDTLVEIELFTNDNKSLVHANELYTSDEFQKHQKDGTHHRYFYDRLPNEEIKRKYERILILNWLVSNHDMHSENYGCLYSPDNFEILDVSPSFDHNSALFDGTIAEFDVPGIVMPNLKYHDDILDKINNGILKETLQQFEYWLSDEQKRKVLIVSKDILDTNKKIYSLNSDYKGFHVKPDGMIAPL